MVISLSYSIFLVAVCERARDGNPGRRADWNCALHCKEGNCILSETVKIVAKSVEQIWQPGRAALIDIKEDETDIM